jgi:iron(III) transport system ATP-binding protein
MAALGAAEIPQLAMKLSLRNVSKQLGGTTVVREMSFDVRDGELFFLLGPSGCGKTTVLRMLAGFYRPDAGEIRFDDRVVNDVPPNRRNTGMVFQTYALWPHLSVAQNVAYGLEVRKLPRSERQRRVDEALAIVRMSEFAARFPSQLSGGQQQRVALARALVIRPDALLLDEPLSNLDAKLRLEMREEIRRIHAETKLTTIYVTHDQAEALSLADRVALMNAGRIEQVGTPRELYQSPATGFVTGFLGVANFVEGHVKALAAGQVRVATPQGDVTCSLDGQDLQVGQPVTCVIRPQDVIVLR